MLANWHASVGQSDGPPYAIDFSYWHFTSFAALQQEQPLLDYDPTLTGLFSNSSLENVHDVARTKIADISAPALTRPCDISATGRGMVDGALIRWLAISLR